MRSTVRNYFFLFLLNSTYFLIAVSAITTEFYTQSKCTPLSPKQLQRAELAARQWAPLIWLAPGEKFFPSSVLDFLTHTKLQGLNNNNINKLPLPENNKPIFLSRDSRTQLLKVDPIISVNLNQEINTLADNLPIGIKSKNLFLETKEDIDSLLSNSSSFIHGHSPHFYSVPVYAVISSCCPRKYSRKKNSVKFNSDINNNEVNSKIFYRRNNDAWTPSVDNDEIIESDFEVTFWLFFPYSEGKEVCTVTAGAFGPIPFPWLRTACLGKVRKYGNHIGDWEHVKLAFKGSEPTAMYVSTHDSGALYSPPQSTRDARQSDESVKMWTYSGHELRRGGRLQNPRFPRRAVTLKSGRPVLFAAKGSHGLWTLPGRHKYVTFPNLEDETGFGASWRTWQNLQILPWPPSDSDPRWLKFQGHWGNSRSGCHPLIDQVCHLSDGPRGIPTKKHAFRCLQTLPQLDNNNRVNNFIKRIL